MVIQFFALLPRLVLIIAALAAAAGPAHAGQDRTLPPASERQRRGSGQLAPGEVVAMLDNYAAVQAQRALALDDAQNVEFVARLRALQQIRRRNRQAHNQAMQDLRRLAGAKATSPYDEAAIRERLKMLREQEDRGAAEMRSAYDAVHEVLEPAQQARFRIFEEMIERRKLDLVMRARQAAARKGSPRP
jgi:hypothetical protein